MKLVDFDLAQLICCIMNNDSDEVSLPHSLEPYTPLEPQQKSRYFITITITVATACFNYDFLSSPLISISFMAVSIPISPLPSTPHNSNTSPCIF